jgi:hypothetical protein
MEFFVQFDFVVVEEVNLWAFLGLFGNCAEKQKCCSKIRGNASNRSSSEYSLKLYSFLIVNCQRKIGYSF